MLSWTTKTAPAGDFGFESMTYSDRHPQCLSVLSSPIFFRCIKKEHTILGETRTQAFQFMFLLLLLFLFISGLPRLTNKKRGDYYGRAASWPQKKKREMGVFLLQRALKILLSEGERQLRPEDLKVKHNSQVSIHASFCFCFFDRFFGMI